MRFVDQAWTQIDSSNTHQKPKQHDEEFSEMSKTPGQPSLHVFCPRMRLLVQCARLNARLPVHELAKMIDMDPQHLIKIEEGRRFPASKTLESLQKVLQVKLVPDNLTRTSVEWPSQKNGTVE